MFISLKIDGSFAEIFSYFGIPNSPIAVLNVYNTVI